MVNKALSTMRKVLFTWSGGKDSALALYELQREHDHEILALLTTLTEDYDRVSMHGVRTILLENQVNSLGLPIEKVYLPKDCCNEAYEAKMSEVLQKGRVFIGDFIGDGFLFFECGHVPFFEIGRSNTGSFL